MQPRFMMALCLAVSTACGGCVRRAVRVPTPPPQQRPTADDIFPRAAGQQGQPPARPVALQVQFFVWTFSLPAMAPEVHQRFWKHVHQDALALEDARALGRNGLRVGLGKPSSWPALRAMLKQSGAETTLHIMSTGQDEPMTLRLESVEPGQPMFYYTRDDQLIGARYGGGTKAWRIEYDIDVDDIATMICRVTPQLVRGVKPALVPRLEPLEDVETFEAMRFEVAVESGEYLIIGPGRRSELATLVGSQFVTAVGEEGDRETIYCLLPRIVRR